MEFILKLILTPVTLILVGKYMGTIRIKDNKSAVVASLLILLIGFLIGWLLTFLLNLLTLGIVWLIGLGIITRTIAYAVIIEMVDKFLEGFDTKGFTPSLILSIILAIVWSLIDVLT